MVFRIGRGGVVAGMLLAMSCSTRIGLRVLKPAAIDIPSIRTLAVADFDMTGSWNFWYDQDRHG